MSTSTAEQIPSGPEPAESAPETHIDRALLAVASVVVLGTIMSILDTTVVNVAIRTLAVRFNTTLPTIQWVATGYTLALAAVIPLSGWIADRFGTKRLYMISIALFLCGSASRAWPGPRARSSSSASSRASAAA
jgi:MFS family permease